MMVVMNELIEIYTSRHPAYLAAGGVIVTIAVALGRVFIVGLDVPINLLPGQVGDAIGEEFVYPSLGVCPTLIEGAVFFGILVNHLEELITSPVVTGWVCGDAGGAICIVGFECVNIDVHDPSEVWSSSSVLIRPVFGLQ